MEMPTILLNNILDKNVIKYQFQFSRRRVTFQVNVSFFKNFRGEILLSGEPTSNSRPSGGGWLNLLTSGPSLTAPVSNENAFIFFFNMISCTYKKYIDIPTRTVEFFRNNF